MPIVKLVLAAQDIVGESLVWDERRLALAWVDIVGRRIHRLDLSTKMHEVWQTPDIVTSVGLREDGGAIVGLCKEIVLWDFDGPFDTLAAIEPDRPDNRLNEGVVAPDGSFWVGTMQNNIASDGSPLSIERDSGTIYRVTSDGAVQPLIDDLFGITNTMVWLTDGRFITADTTKNALYSYRYDEPSSRLHDRQLFFGGLGRGFPDGSCRDAEGYVWNCRVAGGSAVARIAPDGRLDRLIDLPCSWPTSCAFGGDDLSTLFVTSARFTMEAAHLDANPQEGGLFSVCPGVKGLPANRFAQANV